MRRGARTARALRLRHGAAYAWGAILLEVRQAQPPAGRLKHPPKRCSHQVRPVGGSWLSPAHPR